MALRVFVVALPLCAFLTGLAGAQTVLHTFEGTAEFDFLGATVDGAGDVDADGHDDLVVGVWGYSVGGRAIVFSGRTGAVLYTFPTIQFSDASGAGDIDGDGFADIIVGDEGDATFGPSTGRITVYSGATGAILFTATGGAAKDLFGHSVENAGDVDADGVPDVIVGAPQNSTFSPDPGYAVVLSGATGLPIRTFTGASAEDAFGFSTSGAGDVDADGFADLLVGAPNSDGAGNLAGSAVCFSGATGLPLHPVFQGSAALERLGFSVSGGGDVDGDGFDDLVLGSPGLPGKVQVLSGFDASQIHLFTGPGFSFGQSVELAGDVDGDGLADVAVAGPGAGSVYSGADGSLLFQVSGLDISVVGRAGDVDADGRADVIFADPIVSIGPLHEAGRAQVYVFTPCSPQPSNETPRLGTPPHPNALLPGVTSGPIIGATWDPMIDHTTFFPTAVADFVAVSLQAPINIPLTIGTLLCQVPAPAQIFIGPPGVAFSIAIPFDCSLVGLAACSQGGSFGTGMIQLTNALDIVIGTF